MIVRNLPPAFRPSCHRAVPTVPTSDIPDTRFSLLNRIPNPEDLAAWGRFVRIYVPVVCGFAIHRGCQPEEAAMLTRAVMTRIPLEIGSYDPAARQGRFRDWLFRLVVVEAARLFPQLPSLASAPAPGAGAGPESAPSPPPAEEWDSEYQRAAFRDAVTALGEELGGSLPWEIFRRTILDGEGPETVAKDLGVSLGSVYVERSKVLNRVRERISSIEIDWESGATRLSERLAGEEP